MDLSDIGQLLGVPALDALRTGLAQGAIDELEYQRRRSILQRH
jgi:hypothetical protein